MLSSSTGDILRTAVASHSNIGKKVKKIIIMDDDLQHPPKSLISIYDKF